MKKEESTTITQETKLVEFEILKGVPVPSLSKASKYPFDKMEVNESFWVNTKIGNIPAAVGAFRKTNPDKAFKCRTWGTGVMVWRIA